MDGQRLRGILLDIEDHLSDEDRKRLHFYLGGVVPLNMMDRLIEERRISENDLSFLIDAFDQIHCMYAVELLKGHLRRNELKELHQSYQDISMIIPRGMIDEITNDQEDTFGHAKIYPFLNQNFLCEHQNSNSETQEIDEAISSRRNRKQRSSPFTVFQNWRLLLELLLFIGIGIGIGIGILIFFYVRDQRISNRDTTNLTGIPIRAEFSSGVVQEEECHIVDDLGSTGEFVIKPEDALKADIQLTTNGRYELFTRKQPFLNVSGRNRLTAQVCSNPSKFDNNGKISAKLYIKTGSNWTWHESGSVELKSNAATTLVLNLAKIASEKLNDVKEIGVEYKSTVNGDHLNIYLSYIKVA